MHGRAHDCFLLDWDGCLAATLPLWVRLYRRALERRGIGAAEAQICRELFEDWRGPERFGVPDGRRFAEELRRGLLERAGEIALYPEAPEALRGLRAAGVKIAVVTGSPRRAVRPVLERTGLGRCVDLLIAAADVRRPKPDPAGVRRALRRLRVPPPRAVLVGDSPIDVRTGRAAGVDTVLYFPEANRPFYEPARLARCGAGRLIRDLRELLAAPAPAGGQDERPLLA